MDLVKTNPKASFFLSALDRYLRLYDGDKLIIINNIITCLNDKINMYYETPIVPRITDLPEVFIKFDDKNNITLTIRMTDIYRFAINSPIIDHPYYLIFNYIINNEDLNDIISILNDRLHP